jgi:hypothetical protein
VEVREENKKKKDYGRKEVECHVVAEKRKGA